MPRFNPLSTRPKTVCMLGLGMSASEYMQTQVSEDCGVQYDEIWTCNMGLRIFRHDKVWVMDDLRVQAKKLPTYGRLLATHDRPIITSQAYPEFPQSWTYPIKEVVAAVGDDFFRNTVCYAIGYAMVIGVKELTLYGCDFWYPKTDLREEGGMNAAYLLGIARHFGMTFHLPPSTTLLSAHLSKDSKNGAMHRPLYGYVKQPFYTEEEPENAPGTKQGPRVRARKGIDASPANAGEPGNQTKERQGQPAAVRATGENLQRRRRGNNRPARVVLDRSAETDTRGAGGMRASVADGGPGANDFVCNCDTPPYHAANCPAAQAENDVDLRP